jgi:hypothetical protein
MRRLPEEYNGFTGPERHAGSIAQTAAKRRAHGPWFERICLMCKISFAGDGACVIGHLEDYLKPIDAVLPTCVECHERLHRRFWQPNVWIHYLLSLRGGYQPPPYKNILAFRAANKDRDITSSTRFEPDPAKWWEQLSMKPIDYRRHQLVTAPAPLIVSARSVTLAGSPAPAPRRGQLELF